MSEKLDAMRKVKSKYRNSLCQIDSACFDIVSLKAHNKSMQTYVSKLEAQNEILRKGLMKLARYSESDKVKEYAGDTLEKSSEVK